MQKLLIILILFAIIPNVYAQKEESEIIPESFTEKIEHCNINFIQPEGFEETEIIENPDQSYDFAIKHKELKVEIRYFIRAYDETEIEFNRTAPNIKGAMFMATIMNMTHGKSSEFEEFPPDAVKKEFGADWGATSIVELDCEFGKGYKYCTLTTIHKNDIGDVYVFYLYDEIEALYKKMNDLSNNWFYTVTFKKEQK